MKTFFANTLLVLTSCVLTLLFAEAVYRAIQPASDPEYHVKQTANQYTFYRFDEKLGWSNAPFMQGQYRRREFSYPITINEHGMRQGPVKQSPARGIFRIAFLGDSFLWGIGASDDERFSDIIGRLPGFESLNFGVSGYAPVQYILQLDNVISFEPDMVVIAISSNDFNENIFYRRWGYYKPYFALNETGDIELKGYPLKNTKQFGSKESKSRHDILEWSHLARTITTYLYQKKANDQQQGPMDFKSIYRDNQHSMLALEARENAILINKKILESIKTKLDNKEIPMVVILSPSKRDYMKNGRYGAPELDTQVADILENTTSELGIDYINTVQRMDLDDFWRLDGHWNPQGHIKMSEAIHEYLIDNGHVERVKH